MKNIDEKLALNEKMIQIARDGVLKFGNVSIPYLMRKLKCTSELARELIVEISLAS